MSLLSLRDISKDITDPLSDPSIRCNMSHIALESVSAVLHKHLLEMKDAKIDELNRRIEELDAQITGFRAQLMTRERFVRELRTGKRIAKGVYESLLKRHAALFHQLAQLKHDRIIIAAQPAAAAQDRVVQPPVIPKGKEPVKIKGDCLILSTKLLQDLERSRKVIVVLERAFNIACGNTDTFVGAASKWEHALYREDEGSQPLPSETVRLIHADIKTSRNPHAAIMNCIRAGVAAEIKEIDAKYKDDDEKKE